MGLKWSGLCLDIIHLNVKARLSCFYKNHISALLKSPTSDKIWAEHLFISGGNPHLTSRFCGIV